MTDLSEHNRGEAIRVLSNDIKSKNDNLDSTQNEHSKIEIKMQTEIDTTRVEQAKLDHEIKIKQKQIIENTSEIIKQQNLVEKVTKMILSMLNSLFLIVIDKIF